MFPTLQEVMRAAPQLSQTDLDYLQEWMRKQPHLPRLEDIELIPILIRCDYSLERTKEALDKYLTMRTHAPEMFKFRELDTIKDQLKYFHVAPTGKDAKGNSVICMGFEDVELSGFDPVLSACLVLGMMEVNLRYEPATPGYVFITNALNLSAGHLVKATLTFLKKFLTFLQEGAPANITAVHVINLNPVVDKAMLLIKPMLSREVQNKIHFYSKSLDEFYKVIPKDIIPKDYGGSLRLARDYYDELVASLFEQEAWLRTLDSRVVDESKRPGRAKGEGDVFGVDGSFKRLDFD